MDEWQPSAAAAAAAAATVRLQRDIRARRMRPARNRSATIARLATATKAQHGHSAARHGMARPRPRAWRFNISPYLHDETVVDTRIAPIDLNVIVTRDGSNLDCLVRRRLERPVLQPPFVAGRDGGCGVTNGTVRVVLTRSRRSQHRVSSPLLHPWTE